MLDITYMLVYIYKVSTVTVCRRITNSLHIIKPLPVTPIYYMHTSEAANFFESLQVRFSELNLKPCVLKFNMLTQDQSHQTKVFFYQKGISSAYLVQFD